MKYAVEGKISTGSLRVEVEWGKTIEKVKITGEFFAYPEDVIEKIEESLVGLPSEAWESSLFSKINSIVEENNAVFIGVSTLDISRLLKKAVS